MEKSRFISLALVGLLLVSCADFFEPSSPSSIDKKEVFSNPVRTGNAIEAIYNLFGENNSYRNRLACGYQGLNTDIERSTKDKDFTLYCMTPSSSDLTDSDGKDIWSYLNSMVERSNNVIEGVLQYGDTTNELVRYYLGEALVLRSFAYLELTKFWGDVPVRFESFGANPAGAAQPKGDRNDIYEHLRGDLLEAARILPWAENGPTAETKNKTTRASKALAYALLARNNLTYAGYALRADVNKVRLNTPDDALRQALYEEAMNACAEVIKHEDYKLLPDFAQVFKNLCADVEDYSQSEFIWEIPFANGTRGQVLNYNAAKYDKCVGVLKHNVSTANWNSCQTVMPTFVYDFEAGDARKAVTVLPYTWVASVGTGEVSEDAENVVTMMPDLPSGDERLWQKNSNINSFFLGKYRVEWMVRDRESTDDGINYPIVRYADVVLMFCEAAIGGITNTGVTNTTGIDPQEQFNKIRTRAGLGNKELNMENLMKERAFEFCGEYIRKYDLMRWGKLTENLIATAKRLEDLDTHTGEFEQTGDSIYFRYQLKNDVLAPETDVKFAYEMTDIWGLAKGEVGRPAAFDKEAGWVAKCIFISDSKRVIGANANYLLYQDEQILPLRHYYPIFLNNVGTSNGALWNDYGY